VHISILAIYHYIHGHTVAYMYIMNVSKTQVFKQYKSFIMAFTLFIKFRIYAPVIIYFSVNNGQNPPPWGRKGVSKRLNPTQTLCTKTDTPKRLVKILNIMGPKWCQKPNPCPTGKNNDRRIKYTVLLCIFESNLYMYQIV
jgi:hypothetical protein